VGGYGYSRSRCRPELSSWPKPIAALSLEVRELETRLNMAQARHDFRAAETLRLQLTEHTRRLEAAKMATVVPDQEQQ
jgi:hypothetical protein